MKKAVKYEIMKTIRNRMHSICSSAGRPSMVRDGPLPSRRCGVLCSHCMAATPHPLHPSQLSLLHECLIWLLTYAVRVLLTLPSAASTPHKAGCRHANAGYYCHCVLPAPRPPATAPPLQWTPPAGGPRSAGLLSGRCGRYCRASGPGQSCISNSTTNGFHFLI